MEQGKHQKPSGILVILFSDDYHFGVYDLHRIPSTEQMTEMVKRAINAFESTPIRKVIVRFWNMEKNEGLLSYEWSWPKASKVLLSGSEGEELIPKEFSQTMWNIVDAIGVGLAMNTAPIGPLEHRRHEDELQASRPSILKALRKEFKRNF